MTQAARDLESTRKDIAAGAPIDLKHERLPLIEELLNTDRKVCITNGTRTPFVKATKSKADSPVFFKATGFEMAAATVENLLQKTGLGARDVDKFGFATVLPERGVTAFASALETKVGLRDENHQKLAIDRRANCITSLVLTQNIIEAMLLWDLKVGIVGGVEKMSSAALVVNSNWERLLQSSQQTKGFKYKHFLKALGYGNPFESPPVQNIISRLSMGQSCELMARDFGVTPLQQAQFAVASHRKAAIAETRGYLAQEIFPFMGVEKDNMIRHDTDVSAVMRLNPAFKTPGVEDPSINAGTSSDLTDGAAAAVIMTEAEAQSRGVAPLAFITGIEEAKVVDYNRDGLLMAPSLAIPRLLQRHGLKLADIDFFELHEPFAAQFFCVDKIAGPFPMDKVNPNGGAIAIGHPFAASGARYLYSVALEVQRRSETLGRPITALIAVCANEGEGFAMLMKST